MAAQSWAPSGTAPTQSARPLARPAPPTRLLPRVEKPAALPGSAARLLLFAGKGGAGKTTLACATALRLARECPGKRILLFSADPAHSLSDCLATPVGGSETRICPGLAALELDAEAELERLKARYVDEAQAFFSSLTGQGSFDLAFDRDVVERIMDLAPPGLDEVMALTRAMDLLHERRCDILVVDTPPTGHLVRLLELPELIQDWLRVFFDLLLKYRRVLQLPKIADFMVGMSKSIKALRALMTDAQEAQLYAVSPLAEMALAETRDLLAACARMGIHVPALFLNLATPPSRCPLCRALAHAESRVRARFEEACRGVHLALVYRCGEPQGLDRLNALGQALYAK